MVGILSQITRTPMGGALFRLTRALFRLTRTLRLAAGVLAAGVLAAGLRAPFLLAVTPAHAGIIAQTFAPNPSEEGARVDHSAWDKLLKSYVKPDPSGLNRIDYKAFKANGHGALKDYIAMLEGVDVTRLGRSEQFAYWVNLYNAKTIDIVLEHYPVPSIKKINLGGSLFSVVTGGPWDAKVVKVNGIKLSLNDIEHKILRPLFGDPRAHYVVHCASVGCPNLARDAFNGSELDRQLEHAAKAYINNPRGVTIAGGKVTVSSIYNWYGEDFGGSEKAILKHLLRYADAELAAKLRSINSIDNYEYDWSLNDADAAN